MREVHLEVRGMTPKGLGSADLEWRSALLEASRKVPPADVTPESLFSVEATFYLLPQGVWNLVDLDNLSKPLLDSLFRPRHLQLPEGLRGSLFDADDGQVMRLTLRKEMVHEPGDEGVDVAVTWTQPEPGSGRQGSASPDQAGT